MNPAGAAASVAPPRTRRAARMLALACVAAVTALGAHAEKNLTAPSVASKHAEEGKTWKELSPAQKAALKPLEHDWAQISSSNKQKWLRVAERMPSMPAAERARIQTRMTEWTELTPRQRGEVRLQYQEAKQVAPRDRKEQWEAYQALPPERKRQLAARAAAANAEAARKPGTAASAARGDAKAGGSASGKSTIAAYPAPMAAPRAIGPVVVQAQPGATTTLISRRPTPPAHQQTGMPTITASPGFVDKATLLPQRGAQGAAVVSPAKRDPDTLQH